MVMIWMMFAHQEESQHLHQEVYQNFEQEAHQQVQTLINEQKNASLALSLMLSESNLIKTLLKSDCCGYSVGLKQVADKIEQQSPVKSIWLHAVNRDGISMERSWTEHRGDSLIGVRADLEWFLANPRAQPNTTVSTGLFTMSIKTTVPVFDEAEFLGVVEVISQFQPLIDRLNLPHTQSIVLADKRHKPKLILPHSEMFVDGYYVVNTDPNPEFLSCVKRTGVEHFLTGTSYLVEQGCFFTKIPILNMDQQVEGYWLIGRPITSFDFGSVERMLKRYVIAGGLVLTMIILLGVVFISRQQVFLERNYYRDIIDTASDVLFVTNKKRITDANSHFFSLFNEFETLDEFHQSYRCICEVFEPGEGLLQEYMNGIYWVQYILNHPGETHKVKIKRNHKDHYFAIKIQPLKHRLFGMFTVAMQDITEQEEIQHQLTYLSQTDELTGIGNRMFFNQCLTSEIKRSKRYGTSLCLAMFDIDYFKQVNDTYGHMVGDQVLVELCEVVSKQLRETDLFSRYGGEEFIIMLLETEMPAAKKVSERILAAVAAHKFKALGDYQLTCSFGLTCFDSSDTENSILKRVDMALYDSKHNGRNRITIFQP